MIKTNTMTTSAMLSAVSLVFQIIHIGYLTPWGMWIDLVAIPWVLSYFITGISGSLLTMIISTFLISLLSPAGWIGGFMKFIATLPMVLAPFFLVKIWAKKIERLEKKKYALTSLILAILLRGAIVIPVNYYFAIPVFFGLSTDQAIQMVPPLVMFILNAIQGFFDFVIAWLLAFRFKMIRFSI